jgi:hypothetical protein
LGLLILPRLPFSNPELDRTFRLSYLVANAGVAGFGGTVVEDIDVELDRHLSRWSEVPIWRLATRFVAVERALGVGRAKSAVALLPGVVCGLVLVGLGTVTLLNVLA